MLAIEQTSGDLAEVLKRARPLEDLLNTAACNAGRAICLGEMSTNKRLVLRTYNTGKCGSKVDRDTELAFVGGLRGICDDLGGGSHGHHGHGAGISRGHGQWRRHGACPERRSVSGINRVDERRSRRSVILPKLPRHSPHGIALHRRHI